MFAPLHKSDQQKHYQLFVNDGIQLQLYQNKLVNICGVARGCHLSNIVFLI